MTNPSLSPGRPYPQPEIEGFTQAPSPLNGSKSVEMACKVPHLQCFSTSSRIEIASRALRQESIDLHRNLSGNRAVQLMVFPGKSLPLAPLRTLRKTSGFLVT